MRILASIIAHLVTGGNARRPSSRARQHYNSMLACGVDADEARDICERLYGVRP